MQSGVADNPGLSPDAPAPSAEAEALRAAAHRALASLARAAQAMRLYGADHAATRAIGMEGSRALAEAVAAQSPLRLRPIEGGFAVHGAPTVQDAALAEFAAALRAGNLGSLEVSRPASPDEFLALANALARITLNGEQASAVAAAAHEATHAAAKLIPLAGGAMRLQTLVDAGPDAPAPTTRDWARAFDEAFAALEAGLRSLSEQCDDRAEHPDEEEPPSLAEVSECILQAPQHDQSRMRGALGSLVAGMRPEQRRRLLSIEGAHPERRLEALGNLASQLPTDDLIAALEHATERSGALSGHTLKVLSKLVGVTRASPDGLGAVTGMLSRWRRRIGAESAPSGGSGGSHPSATGLQIAIEKLLEASADPGYNPGDYEASLQRLLHLGPTPRTEPPEEPWTATEAHSVRVAAALAMAPDARPEDHARFISLANTHAGAMIETRSFPLLLQAARLAHDAGRAAAPGDEAEAHAAIAAGGLPALTMPDALARLSGAVIDEAPPSREGADLLRLLGPSATGALFGLLAAATTGARRAALAVIRTMPGGLSEGARRAITGDADSPLRVLRSCPDLSEKEVSQVAEEALVGADEARRATVLAAVESRLSTLPPRLAAERLASPDRATRAAALRAIAGSRDPAVLSRLAAFICGDLCPRATSREARTAARALAGAGDLGAAGLAAVIRTLAARRARAARRRLLSLAPVLSACAGVAEIRHVLRTVCPWSLRAVCASLRALAWIWRELQ